MKKAIILEIDGVLSDNRHRLHFLSPSDFKKNPQRWGIQYRPNGEPPGFLDMDSEIEKWFEPDYDAYHAAASEDGVNQPIFHLIEGMEWSNSQHEIIFITGRPEKYRQVTDKWMQDCFYWVNNHSDYELFMRPDYLSCRLNCCCKSGRKSGVVESKYDPYADSTVDCESYCAEDCKDARPDYRPTHIVKREIYEREIAGKYDVMFVLERDEECCEMYKELGLAVLRVM